MTARMTTSQMGLGTFQVFDWVPDMHIAMRNDYCPVRQISMQTRSLVKRVVSTSPEEMDYEMKAGGRWHRPSPDHHALDARREHMVNVAMVDADSDVGSGSEIGSPAIPREAIRFGTMLLQVDALLKTFEVVVEERREERPD